MNRIDSVNATCYHMPRLTDTGAAARSRSFILSTPFGAVVRIGG